MKRTATTKPRKRGRPQWKPTLKQREKVSIWAAGGMSHEQIASVLGIDDDTLRKHLRQELEKGACTRRAEVVEAMFRTAKRGNVAAQKALIAMNPNLVAVLPPPPEKLAGKKTNAPAPEPAPVRVEPLGKKELANQVAQTAEVGTEWADLLKPNARPQ
jgi:DNA-binding CsgD family transcriptional regulator